jgi:hypothetical protein
MRVFFELTESFCRFLHCTTHPARAGQTHRELQLSVQGALVFTCHVGEEAEDFIKASLAYCPEDR